MADEQPYSAKCCIVHLPVIVFKAKRYIFVMLGSVALLDMRYETRRMPYQAVMSQYYDDNDLHLLVAGT